MLVVDVALAVQRLDQLRDHQFARYDLDAEQIAALRDQFSNWPRDSALDELARKAYAGTHQQYPR